MLKVCGNDIMARKSSHTTVGAELSQRQLRVGEMVRHVLAGILVRGDIHDDDLAKYVVTVPEVRMSPDLRLATVFVTPLGGEGAKLVVKSLARNKRFIRGCLAQEINLKYVPDLRFLYDDTFDEVSRIDKLMRTSKVQRDLEND